MAGVKKMEAYEAAGVKIGDKVTFYYDGNKITAIVIDPKSAEGSSKDGNEYVYCEVITSENSRYKKGYIGGWVSNSSFEVIDHEVIDNDLNYCTCGGSAKEYIGFNSRTMICSICGKDKK